MGASQTISAIAIVLAMLGLRNDTRAQCTANAGPPSYTICAGGPQQFNGTASGGTAPYGYSWSPIAGLSDPNIANPICTATVSTNYTLTVTDGTGVVCSTDNVMVTVDPTPSAALTTTGPEQITSFGGLTTFSICDPANMWQFSFADQSTAFPGSVRTLNWGDGSAVVSPAQGWALNHNYNQGLYTLTYTITYPNGCSATQLYNVFLGTNPGGGISTDPNTNICTGGTLPFYINSVAANSPGTTYIIDFGDGQTMNLTHPPPASVNHTYLTSTCGMPGGQLTVGFIAQNPCDQTQGQIGPIRVSETPQAAMTVSPNDTICVGSTVTFTDQSTGLTAPGCSTAPRNIWSITPAAGWAVTGGTLGNDNGSPANPGLWTDGATALNVQFTVPGSYTVTDRTGNTCGTSTISRTICVEAPPVPAFTLSPSAGCAPFAPVNVNTTTSANSCLVTYEWTVTAVASSCGAAPAWNFSSGTSTSLQPQFLFTQPGTYTVQFRAVNSCNVPPVSQVITVNAPPQVDVADLTGICATQCVNPTAVVQNCGSAITTYAWTFAGGTPANSNLQVPPQICYASATSSSITLTATNACGSATDATTLAVGTLPGTPVIASNSPVCAGQTLSLSATPIPGATFSWSGPNGFSSNASNVTITNVNASHAGVYSVVAVSNGCSGPAATVNVVVTMAPTITVTPSSAAICNGQSASFTASGAGNYQWFIGAVQVGTGALFNTSPAITTTYTVSGNVGGCPGSATVLVTVYPVTNVNAGADQTFCDQPIPTQLNAFPSPGTWSGPNVSATGVFTPVPDQLGPVTLTYTHTDGNGCVNDDDVVITVQDLTLIANAGADTSFCQSNTPVTLPASPPGGTWVGAGPGGQFTPSTVGPFVVTYNYGTGTCATSDQLQVQVLPAPTLTVPSDFTRCANAAAEPLGGTPLGGTWSGTGVSGPPYTFDPAAAGAGPHVLTYSYSDASGCSSSATLTATVNPLPVVNAGADVVLCDQPIPYQLGGTPAGGTWTSTTIPVTAGGEVTPAGVATDVFTYTYADAIGCSGSDQITVDVISITQPAFAGNDTSVCVGAGDLQLAGIPVGGTWSGPLVSVGGLLDTDTPGSYTLTYSFGTATCLLQDLITVVVNALPVVDAGDVIATCLEDGIQVLTANPAGGTWSGTGVDASGNFDPLAALPGGNPVTYTYVDPVTACSNSDGTTVTVNPMPVAGMDHDPLACVNVAFPFTNTSSGATSYEWDFGDNSGTSAATNPSHSFTTAGTYTIRLVAITNAGCTDTVYSSVEVWDAPLADITLSTDTGCGPLTVDMTNASVGQGLSYAWDFGGIGASVDEDPGSFVFPADPAIALTYDVTLTVTNVCGVAVATAPVTVIPQPTASFGPNLNEYCSFQEVPFANASIGLPDSFQWDFGDGTTSTDPGPIVTNTYIALDDPMDITVQLIATNDCGIDTAWQQITILPNQVTAFFNTDPINGCSPVTVELTQYSSGDTTFYWDLGDGNLSLAHDLTHTYTTPGVYTIELFAYGCGYDSYAMDIEVFPSPDVDFSTTPLSACAGEPFTFTNLTTDITGLEWDFGDGESSTLSNPEHVYAASGVYDVTLTTTSSLNGCTASLTRQVMVNTTPVAAFTTDPTNGCIDLDVAFTNTSTNGVFSRWTFGDGNSSALAEPFHTYTTPGYYTVQLVAESVNGCTDSTTAEVVAHPLPTSAFTLSESASCGPVAVVQTINASQGAVGYSWDLGNGQTSDLNQPEITYDAPGTYTVTLTSTNQYGCEASASANFTVHPTPIAAFTATPQPGCAGYPVFFDNTSVNSNAYAWMMGDGTSTNADFPLHTYEGPGTYSVRLIAYGAGGCTDTLSVLDAILIHPRPSAGYTTDTLESLAHALQFQNTSEGAISFVWDFDDGEGSTAIHPLHVFPADGGGFTVCLVAVNDFGCPDTICKFINVPGDPDIFVPNAFTPNGDGRNDEFRPVLNGFVGWNYRLMIFDRWGQPAYDTRDRNAAWDGQKNGKEAPVDVYVWKVIVERDGDARDFIGHVSLVR